MSYRDEFRQTQSEILWTFPRIVALGLLAMIGLYGIGFLATGGDLAIYRFWQPKIEDAKRQVFEQTQSYVEGKVEYIGRLRFQYQQSEGPQKDALRTLILSEASTVDNSKFPYELQNFIGGLK